MRRREFLQTAPAFLTRRSGSPADRPHILWLIAEDNGPQWGCYGDRTVRTPHVDRLAEQGVLFRRAYTTAPVCSPSRSAFNTGCYQTAIGAHNHRSHRKDQYRLPEGVKLVPQCFREAGYFTVNARRLGGDPLVGSGKTDWNFQHDPVWDADHWKDRPKDRPLYLQVNFTATHKGPAFVAARKRKALVDPNQVELPPYYADHPVIRDEVANYLDCVNLLDEQVGRVLEMLRRDGLLENCLLFFFGDNGRCLLRGKQWLYDAGVHVPLIVWGRGVKKGAVREDPVSALDIAATSLEAAGIPFPPRFHGQSLFHAPPRTHVFTARDRCDMTVDRIRSVRDARFAYIRNYMPERPYTQYNEYIERQYPTLRVMQELHAAGKLRGPQLVFMAARKPDEELYDLATDPHEVNNLAQKPEHQARLRHYRTLLENWIAKTGDLGAIPESPEEIEREEPRAKLRG